MAACSTHAAKQGAVIHPELRLEETFMRTVNEMETKFKQNYSSPKEIFKRIPDKSSTMHLDRNLSNIIITGVAFFFLFTAFQTASLTSQTVLEAAARESKGAFLGVGYTCLAIVYVSFACFNWLAPTVVLFLGKKYSMFLSSLCYGIFIASFLEPREWSLYLSSCINGIGAAVLWTAQGAFVTDCSRRNNVNKHFGIFWGIFQCNQIVGGLYIFLSLANTQDITRNLRLQLYGGLLGCSLFGSLLFLFLRPPHLESDGNSNIVTESQETVSTSTTPSSSQRDVCRTVIGNICRSFKLLRSKVMLAILAASAFTGVNLTFYSSLYASCLGHTLQFGNNAKSYIGLAGLFIGIGEIVGSFGSHLVRWLRSDGLVLVFGYFTAISGVYIMFLMLPAASPMMDTNDLSYIQPNVYIAVLIAFILGLVDSLWNTQTSALISSIFRPNQDDVPIAFAFFKFVQSIFSALTFAYGTSLLLQWQILIYVIWASIGMIGFYYAHKKLLSSQTSGVAVIRIDNEPDRPGCWAKNS